ncbi:hypothetical protein GCM10009716_24430 [Streptomyces sodiiphilus]|uniref:DUF6199 domain-containing protein n=1 Tax=Streptomyces sodiiphilus TaxID=226217 RepID=A0ABP5AJJ3_9ACTN
MNEYAVMVLLMAAVPVLIGLIGPRKLWWRFSAWKYRNPEQHVPSDAFFAYQRAVCFVGAVVMVLMALEMDRNSMERSMRHEHHEVGHMQ